jgi:hypothetical protein
MVPLVAWQPRVHVFCLTMSASLNAWNNQTGRCAYRSQVVAWLCFVRTVVDSDRPAAAPKPRPRDVYSMMPGTSTQEQVQTLSTSMGRNVLKLLPKPVGDEFFQSDLLQRGSRYLAMPRSWWLRGRFASQPRHTRLPRIGMDRKA